MPRKFSLDDPIFHDDTAARAMLERIRWPNGPRCPSCASANVEQMGGIKRSHRDGLLRCKDCRRQFTVTAGTVFHRSKVPLSKWMQVIYLEDTAGLAADTQAISKATGLSHKTVQKMRARIYAAAGEYKGPNTVFGSRVSSYVKAQRAAGYQRAPKVKLGSNHASRDLARYYAWRRKHPLGEPVKDKGVLDASPGPHKRNGLKRMERLLRHLVSTGPVVLEKKRRRGKVDGPSQARWLPKKTKAKRAASVRTSRTQQPQPAQRPSS